MKRKLIGILTAAAMLLPCVPQLWVTASAAGDIETISNASGLQALATEVNSGTSYAGKKIKLTADITLSGTWTPIGNNALYCFEGTFDGQGHTISGLSVSAENAFCQGLFGYVNGGTIKNLTVTGTVNVSATSTGGQIGGIVGYLNGADAKVISCKSEVTVSAPSYSTAVGGIVGVNASGTVADCYSTGAVEGGYNIGGIVGWNYGTVSNCHHYQGTVTIDKGSARGNIVGENDGDVTRCYYLSTLGGNGIGANGSSYGSDDASPLTTEEFRTPSSFPTWDFTNTWTMGSSYPELRYNPYAGFTNHIKTVEQLEMLRDVVNNNVTSVETYDTYYLDNDLDLSGIEWTPIGTFSHNFSDTFTGWDTTLRTETARTITGLTITDSSNGYNGLFGYVGEGSVIKNLAFSSCNVSGRFSVGCVAAESSGTIQNITVTRCTLSSNNSYCGAVAYSNSAGTVNNVTVTDTTVSGQSYIGGAVGSNSGTIDGVTVTGTAVSGEDHIGGIAGSTSSRPMQNVTVSGGTSVTGSGNRVGGVAGYNFATVENVTINNITVSGNEDVGGIIGRGNSPIGTRSVTGANVTGAAYVGGAVGNAYNTFNGSGFSASNLTVSGTDYVGGVIGYSSEPITNVTLSSGTVSGGSYVGGITGYSSNSISGCTNNATVTAQGSKAGGIVGGVDGSYYNRTISDCVNNGSVTGTGSNISGIGGIVGHQTVDRQISGCINSGTIRADGYNCDSIGGIVGFLETGTVTGCHMTSAGTVTGYVNVGGIAGKNNGTVRRSYNDGTVGTHISDTNVGGVVGSNDYSGAILENCYNTGSVEGTVIGGVIGISIGRVENCYSTGSMNGGTKGGVIGNNNGGTVTSCYYLNTTTQRVAGQGYVDSASRALTADEFLDETNFVNWDFNDTSVWTLSRSAGAPVFFDLKLTGSGKQETGYYTDSNDNYYEDATAFIINLNCGSVSTRPYIKGTITSGDNTKSFEGQLGAEISQGSVVIGLVVTGLADAGAELSAMAMIE